MRLRLDPTAPNGISVAQTPVKQTINKQSHGYFERQRTSFANIVTSDPATGEDGDIIFNMTDVVLKIWYDGQWNEISGGGGGTPATGGGVDNLLVTNGNLLIGTGSVLLL